jgi:hypothetical protein
MWNRTHYPLRVTRFVDSHLRFPTVFYLTIPILSVESAKNIIAYFLKNVFIL